MISFQGRVVLLDIEGTTSSVSFVYDVMFPFVRRELDRFLEEQWESDSLREACNLIAQDAGYDSLNAWNSGTPNRQKTCVRDQVMVLMDNDVKATGLKRLQGLVWQHGFESGELKAHLYDDVLAAIREWRQSGISVQIYSSGSVQAQRLFFGHTVAGDLLSLFDGHYDTTVGSKREASSYDAIAQQISRAPQHILFLSDVTAELDAAAEAGMRTGLCRRPGNAPVNEDHGHDEFDHFGQVQVQVVDDINR